MSSNDRMGETHLTLLSSAQEYLQAMMSHSAPDSELASAWSDFYRTYSTLIRKFVISCGVRDTDVDDCLQEVWAEVSQRLTAFRRAENRPGLRAWLYTIVRSKATNMFRRTKRQPAGVGGDDNPYAEPADSRPGPADRYEWNWQAALVQTLLEELKAEVSELNYAVVHRRLVEGQEIGEVAAALSITPEQVRYRQHRMLKKLRVRAALYTGEECDDRDEGTNSP